MAFPWRAAETERKYSIEAITLEVVAFFVEKPGKVSGFLYTERKGVRL